MTPLAREYLEVGERLQTNKWFYNTLSKARCYDFTALRELIKETMDALGDKQNRLSMQMEHGGLLLIPDKIVWLEVNKREDGSRLPGRSGILLQQLIKDGKEAILCFALKSNGDQLARSCLSLFDTSFMVGPLDPNDIDCFDQRIIAGVGLQAAASLIILNAPYGIDKTEYAPHKGFARKLRKQGLLAPKPYTIISLSKSAPAHLTGAGTGHHKAFHFVRSHLRHYNNGLTSKVKAHWRGDPALGILKTDYKVIH
jgi:hypothetical protein